MITNVLVVVIPATITIFVIITNISIVRWGWGVRTTSTSGGTSCTASCLGVLARPWRPAWSRRERDRESGKRGSILVPLSLSPTSSLSGLALVISRFPQSGTLLAFNSWGGGNDLAVYRSYLLVRAGLVYLQLMVIVGLTADGGTSIVSRILRWVLNHCTLVEQPLRSDSCNFDASPLETQVASCSFSREDLDGDLLVAPTSPHVHRPHHRMVDTSSGSALFLCVCHICSRRRFHIFHWGAPKESLAVQKEKKYCCF